MNVRENGTLIKTKTGKVFPVDTNDWQLLYENIPGELKKLHSDGHKIVIFTNQKGIQVGKVDRNGFKKKIESIVSKLGCPVQAFVSVAGGHYRKPCIGMWAELQSRNDDVEIKKEESVYVGDAAGRIKTKNRPKKDHSFADRFFASNVGVRFQTPEEFFQKSNDSEPWGPPSFDPKSLFGGEIAMFDPKDAPLKSENQEIIVMVGFPGSGKSTFVKWLSEQNGYKIVNRDTTGTWQKCVATCKSHLKNGDSVIIDNTSPDVESRQRYIHVAKEERVECRCFVMNCEMEHAQHNIRYRTLTNETAQEISSMVLRIHKGKYVEPKEEEGFKQIVKVNFQPKFEVKEHEELYKMYLID
uniref:Bifunctional polynucleotide phosphatase/kinase n=1 Tax=Caenorhabditis tropicalis TaxID=1561998 RepID=A0A1I7TPF0_9PELO